MSDEYINDITQLPDYLDGADDQTIHNWKAWMAMTKKIDEHPERIYIVVNQHNGQTKEIDCKNNVGIAKKMAKNFGATQADIDEIHRIGTELQLLKVKKATFNKAWTKSVYNKKRGDKGILDLRKSEVLDLMGKFYTIDEIHRITQDKWGTVISTDALRKFSVDNKDKVDKRKADYILNSKELRLATDAGRMEVLSMLAYEMQCKFEKGKGIETSKELRAIIEQIRKEVKGEEIKLTIDGRIDINATIQANQTLHEFLQKLPINMIVIGLTAAKQGLNPAALIASLGNSYYSKFNGFNKLADKGDIQLPGQYIKQYNWDDIKMKNESQIIDIEPIEVYEEAIPETKKMVAKTKKEELLALVDKYKNQSK